jgi:chemotaxis protein MotA
MKVMVTGGVQPHDLSEMMEQDLETAHHEESQVPDAVQNMADALPAVGIVACVLGVIITMGHIGGAASEIGRAIGNALVGTLLGVLVSYVVVAPIARAMTLLIRANGQYLHCIRQAIESGARGESPMNSIEFARRNIDPSVRPSFSEVSKAVKERGRNK